jgi:hypothetical protein
MINIIERISKINGMVVLSFHILQFAAPKGFHYFAHKSAMER